MLYSLSQLHELREQAKGKTLVAACGCFDIFHVGHLEYLQGAKQLGDRLIVGINSDVSVYKNKGKPPHFCQKDRIALVSAIDVVDDVVCFDSQSFAPVLYALRPQVFARGVDARQKGFPERIAVQQLGIHVETIGRQKRASSSQLRRYFCMNPWKRKKR